jgi:hypothetical protein
MVCIRCAFGTHLPREVQAVAAIAAAEAVGPADGFERDKAQVVVEMAVDTADIVGRAGREKAALVVGTEAHLPTSWE